MSFEPAPVLIAIIDADPTVRDALSMLLRIELGIPSAASAALSHLAAELAPELYPGLFIIGDDPATPDGTGTLISQVLARYPSVPVIALWERIPQFPPAGATSLNKYPIDSTELIAHVRRLVQNSASRIGRHVPTTLAK